MRPALTRELLVERATAAIEAEGVDGVSLRGIARDLGVTAPALYAYVTDKRDLLAAVAEQQFAALVERFRAIVTDDPLERLRQQSRAYVEQAIASPGLFRVMFRFPPAALPVADEPFAPAQAAFEAAAGATVAAAEAGLIEVDDPVAASLALWAAVHGVAEVVLAGMGADPAASSALLDRVVDTMLAGMAPRR